MRHNHRKHFPTAPGGLADGVHAFEIIARTARPVRFADGAGFAFSVIITEGPSSGATGEISFATQSARTSALSRTARVLSRWAEAVDAAPAAGPMELVANLRRASEGHRVVGQFVRSAIGGRSYITLVDIAVTPKCEADNV